MDGMADFVAGDDSAVGMALLRDEEEIMMIFVTALGALALRNGCTPNEYLDHIRPHLSDRHWGEVVQGYFAAKAAMN